MKCLDPLCEPEKGEDGCMASICNVDSHDALDIVWVKAWDSCPLANEGQEA